MLNSVKALQTDTEIGPSEVVNYQENFAVN